MSETALAKPHLQVYCCGWGLDLGCGDDLIVPWAIGIDRHQRGKTNIIGDITDLHQWFQVNSMDFCFSSHALEDAIDTTSVLKNWLSVVKHGGYLALYLPDQIQYEAHCRKHGVLSNQDHKHPDFGLRYVMNCLNKLGYNQNNVVYCKENIGEYSFALVIKKP